jgi:hypothetical protein
MHRETPVRPILVVKVDVTVEHPSEMTLVDDKETRWRSCSPLLGAQDLGARLGCAGTPKSDRPMPSS